MPSTPACGPTTGNLSPTRGILAEDCRGTGLGGCILDQVEAAGARQGARRVELNTFSFQAPGFYEKRGYRRIGALEPAVGEYGHFFYAKEL